MCEAGVKGTPENGKPSILHIILISIIGIFLALSLYTKKQVIPDPIPVCTEKKVSGLIHCGECHEKGEY